MDKLPEDRSDWDSSDTAWAVFAGIILGLLGVFNVVEGLLTLLNDRYGGQIGGAFFFFNLTGWGWLHLLLGLALLAVTAALLMDIDWAPSIAVGLAGATAIFQMIYINIIPTWSWVNVALAILIIYVLMIKGRNALSVTPRPQVLAQSEKEKLEEDKSEKDKSGGNSAKGDIEP